MQLKFSYRCLKLFPLNSNKFKKNKDKFTKLCSENRIIFTISQKKKMATVSFCKCKGNYVAAYGNGYKQINFHMASVIL